MVNEMAGDKPDNLGQWRYIQSWLQEHALHKQQPVIPMAMQNVAMQNFVETAP